MCKDGGMVEGVSLKDLKDVVELAIGTCTIRLPTGSRVWT